MYVGVDVHKKVCRAAIVNDEGEIVNLLAILSPRIPFIELIRR